MKSFYFWTWALGIGRLGMHLYDNLQFTFDLEIAFQKYTPYLLQIFLFAFVLKTRDICERQSAHD